MFYKKEIIIKVYNMYIEGIDVDTISYLIPDLSSKEVNYLIDFVNGWKL